MAINHLELVSALVDGQLTGSELEQALELVNNDSSVREAFMRFQQASDILHGYTRSITQAPLELTTRISAALEAEPVYSIPTQNKPTAKLLRFPKNLLETGNRSGNGCIRWSTCCGRRCTAANRIQRRARSQCRGE